MPKRDKILIVDDDRSIRELLEILLKNEGLTVISAAGAEKGLAEAKATEFDVIISDLKMPNMTGIDFLRELRETGLIRRRRGEVGTQFILLTAHAEAEAAVQALKMGAFDYILKDQNCAEEAFVSVNCGAFTETLLESELFGYMRGAFTGAATNKKGLFEVSDKGTIFLDEVGDTSLAMQVKLLRVLQERNLRRVGGTEEIPVDVRIIAATNRDLSEMVAENQFREDLFYRISVIPLELPPLRHRRDDIPLLADHFLARLNASMGRKFDHISDEALKKLESYDWPGNVRELENALERAFILETSNELSTQHL